MDKETKVIERIKREMVLLKRTQKFLEAHEQEIKAEEEKFNTLGIEIDNDRKKTYRKHREENIREKENKLKVEALQSQQEVLSVQALLPSELGTLPHEDQKYLQNENNTEYEYFYEVLASHQCLLTEIQKWDQCYFDYYVTPEDSSLDSASSVESERDESVEKYSLTQKAKAKHKFIQKKQMASEKSKMQKSLEKKLNELYIIKNKMLQGKYAFECHKSLRLHSEKIDIAKALQKKFNIDIDKIHNHGDNIIDIYRKYEKANVDFKRKKLENRIEILGRLLMEEKKKNTDYRIREVGKSIKVPRRILPLKDAPLLEIDTKLLGSLANVHNEQNLEQEATHEVSEQETKLHDEPASPTEDDEKVKISKKRKKDKTGKKVKVDKQSKKEKGKGKKEKRGKGKRDKHVKEDLLDTLKAPPPPPRRHHVEAENILFPELLRAFEWTDELQKDMQIIRAPPPSLVFTKIPFIWKPNVVLFKDFRLGHVYRRHVVVTNTSLKRVYCQLMRLELDDDLQLEAFEVDIYNIHDVCPGMSFEFTIEFRPLASTKEVLGEVIFKTWHVSELPQQNFVVPIHCYPKLPDSPQPQVRPSELMFSNVPVWSGRVFKTLKLINNGTMGCFVNIQKLDEQPEPTPVEEVIVTEPCIPENEPIVTEKQSELENVGSDDENLNKKSSKSKSKTNKEKKRSKKSKGQKTNSTPVNNEPNNEEMHVMELLEVPGDEMVIAENVSEEQQIVLPSEAQLSVSDILDECVNNVFDMFCLESKYHIRLEPKSILALKVWFGDHLYGIYQEKFIVRFEDNDSNCILQVMIPFCGEIIPPPLAVEPVVIDLQTCLFDGGIYRSPFKVHNTSSLSVSLTVHIPSCLRNHVKVVPKQSYVNAKCSVSFSVILAAKCGLHLDAPKYYSAETQVLDFPVSVCPVNSTLGHCNSLVVQVLAIVTTPHALVLTPAKCDLGTVTTLETVCKVLTLTNISLAVQRYFFINLPDSVLIQPCGNGMILPGESRKLHLLYSPRPCDIEGNSDLVSSGKDGKHRFILKCTTVTSHMDSGNRVRTVKRKNDIVAQENSKEITIGKQDKNDLRSLDTEAYHLKHKYLPCILKSCGIECLSSNPPNSDTNVDNKRSETIELTRKSVSEPLAKVDGASGQKLVERKETIFGYFNYDSKEDTNVDNKTSETIELTRKSVSEPLAKDAGASSQKLVERKETIFGYFNYDLKEDLDLNEDTEELDNRLEKNMIQCCAFVIDPLCELSATKVIFPATPCSSYSLVNIRLQAFNKATEPDCRCGVLPAIGHRKKKFYVCFEFQSEHESISVQPCYGHVLSGESVRITLVFEPVLVMEEVEFRARTLKAKVMMEERKKMKLQEELSKNKKKHKGDKKTKSSGTEDQSTLKKSKRSQNKGMKESAKNKSKMKGRKDDNDFVEPLEEIINPEEVTLEPADLFPAEKSLLETLDPYTFEATVKCLVKTFTNKEENSSRMEVHRLMVKCPVVRPDFLLRCTSEYVAFGHVAIGTRPRCLIDIQNISTSSIPVSVSMLNPLGSFFCPPFTTQVAPEHILTLPITFGPINDIEQLECFEVRSGRTVMPMILSGTGVAPQFDILPDFLVYRFEVKSGKEGICTIEVQNNCIAPLTFKMNRVFVKETEDCQSSPARSPDLLYKDDEKVGKKKKAKQKKKPIKLKTFDAELSPEENIALEYLFKESEEDLSKLFTTVGMSESNEITINPNEKASFRVKFVPPKEAEHAKIKTEKAEIKTGKVKGQKGKSASAKKSPKNKQKRKNNSSPETEKKDESEAESAKMETILKTEKVVNKPPMKYVAKYDLMLGNIVHVREYIFMASVQRKKEKGAIKTKDKKKAKK